MEFLAVSLEAVDFQTITEVEAIKRNPISIGKSSYFCNEIGAISFQSYAC